MSSSISADKSDSFHEEKRRRKRRCKKQKFFFGLLLYLKLLALGFPFMFTQIHPIAPSMAYILFFNNSIAESPFHFSALLGESAKILSFLLISFLGGRMETERHKMQLAKISARRSAYERTMLQLNQLWRLCQERRTARRKLERCYWRCGIVKKENGMCTSQDNFRRLPKFDHFMWIWREFSHK